jgi:hypothetical protein
MIYARAETYSPVMKAPKTYTGSSHANDTKNDETAKPIIATEKKVAAL